jgi:hypothetical protein
MHQRDILEEEVLQVLACPPSAHRHRSDGRSEARGKLPKGHLKVIYRRGGRELWVINAMWD